MGDQNLVTETPLTIIRSSRWNSLVDAFKVALVPRNSSGVPASDVGKLGDNLRKWLEINLGTGSVANTNIYSLIAVGSAIRVFKEGVHVESILNNNTDLSTELAVPTCKKIFLASGTISIIPPELLSMNQKHLIGQGEKSTIINQSLTFTGSENKIEGVYFTGANMTLDTGANRNSHLHCKYDASTIITDNGTDNIIFGIRD